MQRPGARCNVRSMSATPSYCFGHGRFFCIPCFFLCVPRRLLQMHIPCRAGDSDIAFPDQQGSSLIYTQRLANNGALAHNDSDAFP